MLTRAEMMFQPC